jgi:hypothetical protein
MLVVGPPSINQTVPRQAQKHANKRQAPVAVWNSSLKLPRRISRTNARKTNQK